MNPIRAAAVQFNHVPGDKAANLETVARFVRGARFQGVDLLVFPEMCVTGYWHVRNLSREQIVELAEPVPQGPTTQVVLQQAIDHDMAIGVGLIEQSDGDGLLYNTYVVAMPNGQVVRHRKIHCFISEHMGNGDEVTVFDMPQGCRAGILTCYDNNIVENVRLAALQGADVILAPHQTGGCDSRSPAGMKPIDVKLWENRNNDAASLRAEMRGPKGRGWLMRWLPARAHDNGLFVVFSNGVGLDDGEVRTGNAMILDPYGRILVESERIDNDMVISDLDPSLREMSTGCRWIAARRPELYGPLAQPTGREVPIRDARFADSLPAQAAPPELLQNSGLSSQPEPDQIRTPTPSGNCPVDDGEVADSDVVDSDVVDSDVVDSDVVDSDVVDSDVVDSDVVDSDVVDSDVVDSDVVDSDVVDSDVVDSDVVDSDVVDSDVVDSDVVDSDVVDSDVVDSDVVDSDVADIPIDTVEPSSEDGEVATEDSRGLAFDRDDEFIID